MPNPVYVCDNPTKVPPVAPVLFTNDLKTYTPQTALGTLFQAAGVAINGGDLYYDGTTVIATAFNSPAVLAVWTAAAGWTTPLILTDGNSTLGSQMPVSGPVAIGTQPQSGSGAIGFDGTTYVVGAIDSNGNTAVYIATNPSAGPWTLVNLDTNAGFDGVYVLKWIPRLGKWVAIGEQIWTAPQGAAVWTSRSSADFYGSLYDDGTTLWVLGNSKIWSSTDGVTWTANNYPSPSPYQSGFAGGAPLFYIASLNLWVGPNNDPTNSGHNQGLLWATTPLGPWTYGYTSPNNPPNVPSDAFNSFAQVGGTVYATGNRKTQNSPVNTEALIASTIDGKTWTITVSTLPEAPSTPSSSLGNVIGAPDGMSLGISLQNETTTNPNTNVYSSDGGATLINEFLSGQFGRIIGLVSELTSFNNSLLIDTLTHKGPSPWSTFSGLPTKSGMPVGIITTKEVQFTDPVTDEEDLGVLMACDDGKIYQLFGGTQDGSIVATAVTWPLPDLSQLPFELRDTIKIFREIWVEGEDVSNWQISWSTDGLPYYLPGTFTVNPNKVFSPPRPLQNRTQIGARGRQIEIMFTHAAATTNIPLLSYMKINYDIDQQAAGGLGVGANY